MGVDYRVWLIPKDRAFTPAPEQIAALANALREGKWVPLADAPGQRSRVLELLPGGRSMDNKPSRTEPFLSAQFEPSWVASHTGHELVLEWWVDDAAKSDVRFPFNFLPYPQSGFTYFGIRMILGQEYFYWTGESVMPFIDSATQCRCGEQLAYWTGFAYGVPSQRIRPDCPTCGRAFDISKVAGEILHPWTGERRSVTGGMAFRFAFQVDAHKNFPNYGEEFGRFRLQDGIHELWRVHIATPYETIDTAD